jgi:hypothetical protein
MSADGLPLAEPAGINCSASPASAASTATHLTLGMKAGMRSHPSPSRHPAKERRRNFLPQAPEDRARQRTARVLAEAAEYDVLVQKLANQAHAADTAADADRWRDGVALIAHAGDSFDLQNATLVHAVSLYHRFRMVRVSMHSGFVHGAYEYDVCMYVSFVVCI